MLTKENLIVVICRKKQASRVEIIAITEANLGSEARYRTLYIEKNGPVTAVLSARKIQLQ